MRRIVLGRRMISTTTKTQDLSEALVACNVYVSAGSPSHQELLTKLLRDAQQHCESLRKGMSKDDSLQNSKPRKRLPSAAIVVHAYADPVYNRSSFHLAGSADQVSSVAANLANDAIQLLQLEEEKELQPEEEVAAAGGAAASSAHHPYVGRVDHVAVMPLIGLHVAHSEVHTPFSSVNNDDDYFISDHFVPWTGSGWAARMIGQRMKEHPNNKKNGGLQIFYYGSASSSTTPLAQVRREKTNFFRSGGLLEEEEVQRRSLETNFQQPPQQQVDLATVGAPLCFTENYNVRLTRHCSKRMAQSLTRYVRERDGGLPGVEALTLPYSDGRYEVACNLLRPDLASADDIQARVEQWEQEQRKLLQPVEGGTNNNKKLVEIGYRVGTTAEQCLSAQSLAASASDEERQEHNDMVLERLLGYIASTHD